MRRSCPDFPASHTPGRFPLALDRPWIGPGSAVGRRPARRHRARTGSDRCTDQLVRNLWPGQDVGMPELPEVEALAEFLREEAVGRTVTRVDAVAISALKMF